MFTIQKIEEASSKVKSGADFPKLVQEFIELGIKTNDVYVNDGHAEYFGNDGFSLCTDANYPAQEIAEKSDGEKFLNYLKIHQQGQTDYPTFCVHAAETGVEKWTLDFEKMTCTYFDKAGNELLVEQIPLP